MAVLDPVRSVVQYDPLTGDIAPAMPAVEPAPDDIEAILGHRFRDRQLLHEALTHASAVRRPTGRRRERRSNERLEFLGDRVLGLVAAHMLIEHFRNDSEGTLALRQDGLVRRETLATIAQKLGVGRWLVVAKSEEDGGGRDNPAILADTVEALIGAIYLDGGWSPAEAFVRRHWQPLVASAGLPSRDPKTALQEWAQARAADRPIYTVVSTEGPPHAPTFVVSVSVADKAAVAASGHSKRAAEQAAARLMLDQLAGTPS
jgi:ribonuclease III